MRLLFHPLVPFGVQALPSLSMPICSLGVFSTGYLKCLLQLRAEEERSLLSPLAVRFCRGFVEHKWLSLFTYVNRAAHLCKSPNSFMFIFPCHKSDAMVCAFSPPPKKAVVLACPSPSY